MHNRIGERNTLHEWGDDWQTAGRFKRTIIWIVFIALVIGMFLSLRENIHYWLYPAAQTTVSTTAVVLLRYDIRIPQTQQLAYLDFARQQIDSLVIKAGQAIESRLGLMPVIMDGCDGCMCIGIPVSCNCNLEYSFHAYRLKYAKDGLKVETYEVREHSAIVSYWEDVTEFVKKGGS